MLSPRAHDAQDGGVSEDSAGSGGDRLLPFFSADEEPAGSQFLAPDSYIRGVVRHEPSVAHGSGAGLLRFAFFGAGFLHEMGGSPWALGCAWFRRRLAPLRIFWRRILA